MLPSQPPMLCQGRAPTPDAQPAEAAVPEGKVVGEAEVEVEAEGEAEADRARALLQSSGSDGLLWTLRPERLAFPFWRQAILYHRAPTVATNTYMHVS